jgi:hypothetical protein
MAELFQYLDTIIFQLVFIPFLYAETHYRFKYFFSYLKKKEPEIIADIPSRITSGLSIPILVIIKDADKYPVLIKEISVIEDKQVVYSQKVNNDVSTPYQDLIIEFPTSDLACGQHYFGIKISYEIEGENKFCLADNHRGTSHKPLPMYISKDPLPRFDNCFLGETHSHTNYTSDQVEFGASLTATNKIAKAVGLDFFCATDHSYDLDDHEDNYLMNDPDLIKWTNFQHEVENINRRKDTVLIIPGEEVTVRNKNEKNVHLLIYNSKKFFPGTGDSGEKWFKNVSEFSISQVISELTDTALAVSAHPSETAPLLQKLFINRGSWQSEDCAESGLHGLQFINGGESYFLERGKKLWIEQLLAGNRLTGIAGNDAHGNFSRFRQIGFPFFTMRENYAHIFGYWRTGVYINDKSYDVSTVLNALRSGNCYMTNGPALILQIFDGNKDYLMGEVCPSPKRFRIRVRTTEEFGNLKSLQIMLGDLDKRTEIVFYSEPPDDDNYEFVKEISLENLPNQGYLRAEVTTTTKFQALSNPIWFNHHEH